MSDKRDSYLSRDSKTDIWYVRITLPDYLRQLFNNNRIYTRSTGTRDIRDARLFRDACVLEFNKLRNHYRPSKASGLERALQELQGKRKQTDAKLPVSERAAPAAGCPPLRKLCDQYLDRASQTRKLTTLSKYQKAISIFCDFHKRKDLPLHDINRTMVTAWIDSQRDNKAVQTIANYLGCLSQLVEFARNRYHDAPTSNVFRGHNLEVRQSREGYIALTDAELKSILAELNGDDEMLAVTLIGMHTGMRLNEICSLQPEHIREIEGVLCFEIMEGKTRSAARIIPVHSQITDLVSKLRDGQHNGFLFYRASITNRADGKRSTWHTQRFTRAKRKALGTAGTERKVFHSLRHGVAQQLDRAMIPEDRIALLLGHERGNTESFRTYSRGAASPVELMKYIEMISYDVNS